jgi:hypothetical protein
MPDRQAIAVTAGGGLAAIGIGALGTLVILDWTIKSPILDLFWWFWVLIALSVILLTAGLYLLIAPFARLPLPAVSGSGRQVPAIHAILRAAPDEQELRRRREDRARLRERLGSELRVLVRVGQDLQSVMSRLINDPAKEVQFAPSQLAELRDQVKDLVEPELVALRDELWREIATVMQWVAMREGDLEDRNQGRPVNPGRLARLDEYESHEPGRAQELTDRARNLIAETERAQ